MELSHLRAFVAISRDGGITAAAASLHLTPSPVSRSLRDLEAELGSELFERGYHRLSLTSAGAAFLPNAVEVLNQFNHLPQLMRAESPALRVGFSPWLPRRTLEGLQACLAASGEQQPLLEEGVSSRIINRVRHGDLDLAMVSLPVHLPQMEFRLFESFGCRLYLADPGIESGSTIRIAQLAGRRVLMLHTEFQPAAMGRIADGLRAAGVSEIEEVGPDEVMAIESRLRRTSEVLLGPSPLDTPIPELLANTALSNVIVEPSELRFDVGIVWRSNNALAGPRIARLSEHFPYPAACGEPQ